MHLILTSGNLQQFQHIHPELGGDGSYRVETTLPVEGTYVLYNEFVRGEYTVLDQREIVVRTASDVGTSLSPDTAAKTVDGLTLSLNVPETITANQATEFGVTVTRDGQPVTSLEPYLGAAAHVAIVSENGTDFAHTHGEAVTTDAVDGHGDEHAIPAAFGPDLRVAHTFAEAGHYKLWIQVSLDGEVITVPFVVDVE
jgi:Cu+-exporting ATPase